MSVGEAEVLTEHAGFLSTVLTWDQWRSMWSIIMIDFFKKTVGRTRKGILHEDDTYFHMTTEFYVI